MVKALFLHLASVMLVVSGCALWKPTAQTSQAQSEARASAGQIAMAAKASPARAGLIPVYVLIQNNTETTYRIVTTDVAALDAGGHPTSAVSPLEAASAMSESGKSAAKATQQVNDMSLRPELVQPGQSVGGYVFVPEGSYKQMRLTVFSGEGGPRHLLAPW